MPIFSDILKAVDALLEADPGSTGESIAQQLGIGRTPLSYAVRLYSGLTLVNYIRQWRLRRAKQLLHDHSVTYRDVARRCGFHTVHDLSAFLMRMIKCTAYEYREHRSNGHRKL